MKERIKNIAIILIGIISITSLTVSAATLIESKNVVYDNTASGLKSTTVQGAVDELYSAATDYSSVIQRLQALEENKFLNAHPVGSIYVTVSEDENTIEKMHNLYGGTWESYGQGRTLVGVGTGTDSNGTVKVFNKNESSGEYNHTLTVSEMPEHGEHIPIVGVDDYHIGTYLGKFIAKDNSAVFSTFKNVGRGWKEVEDGGEIVPAGINKGGSQSHNNIQPYITVYMYKRVS